MSSTRKFSRLFPAIIIALLPACRAAEARERMPGTGSAIAPLFSVQHASMRPGESVVLLACVTNRNAESRRVLAPGDRLSFEGAGIEFLACEIAPVQDRGAGFDPGDWTCEIDGASLRLTYGGSPRGWPRGELACARVTALAPTTSATVLPEVDAANYGAWAPAEPAVLFLSVDAAIGSVGPAGPVGPPGPAGLAGLGELGMAVSTGAVLAHECEPPTPVPGLDAIITVADDSRIMALVDAVTHKDCRFYDWDGWKRGVLLLELDGVVVARRVVDDVDGDGALAPRDHGSGTFMAWRSEPLTAGAHRVRVLFEFGTSEPPCMEGTQCIGGPAGSDREARLVVLGTRAP